MNIRKLGLILIPALILYLVYDKFFSKKDFLPNIQKLELELSLKEEALLQSQFDSKKFKTLQKQFSLNSKDFRLYEKKPESRVHSQIRQATSSKLKVISYSSSTSKLKELYKDSESQSSIYYFDTTVNAQNLSVRDLSNIITRLRKQRPRLVWKTLSINANNPKKISLNGSLRAFFLSEDLSQLLKGGKR